MSEVSVEHSISSKDTLEQEQSPDLPAVKQEKSSSPIKSEPNASPTPCVICALPNPLQSSVNQDILVYFLKKLLKYQLLSNSQISTLTLNESSIHFCQECDEQLTASFSLHLEIVELESKLAQIRSNVEDKILATLNSDGVDFWGQQVRRRVREESSTITPEIIKFEREESSFEPFEFLAVEQDNDGNHDEEGDDILDPVDVNDYYDDNDDDMEQEDDIEIIETPPKPPTVTAKKKPINKFKPKRGRPRREDVIQKLASKTFATTPCPLCSMKFATGSALSTHIARTHKQNKFTCRLCKMTFSRRDYFEVHISCHSDYPSTGGRVSATDVEDPIVDLSSDSSASSAGDSDSDFALPERKSHNRDPKKKAMKPKKSSPQLSDQKLSKTCPLCPTDFDNYPTMIRHLNSEHETTPKFSCEFESCERKFLKEDYLASHRRKEHGDTTTLPDAAIDFAQKKLTQRTCPGCWKIFERPSTMTSHHTAVHLNLEKSFICEICAKQFKRHDTLKKHLEYHETGLKIYKCDLDQCEKRFRRKRDMEVHQRLHTGVKGFLCSLCGQSFRHEWSFRRHNILLHGLRPSKTYECKTCGKVFKIKWHLDQHLQSKSHGGSGLKKRVRRRKNSGEDTGRKKITRTKSPSRGKNREQEQPIDLVFDQRNNDVGGGSTVPIPIVRPSHQRFLNNFEIPPPHPSQQPQHFADGHFSTNWCLQPGFNPSQNQQFF